MSPLLHVPCRSVYDLLNLPSVSRSGCHDNNRQGGRRRVLAQGTVPLTATTIGMNVFGLDVHRVLVNGQAVKFSMVPYQWGSLPATVLQATGSKLDAAYHSVIEDTDTEYQRFLQQEELPELLCHVRPTDSCGALGDQQPQ
jgi:hypothetical protein